MDIPPDRTDVAGQVSAINPMGTDGFEFVEFTGPDIAHLEATFTSLGFAPVAYHRVRQPLGHLDDPEAGQGRHGVRACCVPTGSAATPVES